MIRSRANFLANLGSRVWAALSIYFFLPAYYAVLGKEAFGLVAFFATLNVAITVLVSGWTKALRLHFSKPDVPLQGKYHVLRSFELACVCTAGALSGIGWLAAPMLAEHMLSFRSLSTAEVVGAVRLMFGCVGLQLFAAAYAGCLHGLLLQVRAGVTEMSWSAGRGLGALTAAWLSSGDVVAFFCGFLVADALYALALRVQLTAVVGGASRQGWRLGMFGNLAGLSTMSLGIGVVSIVYFFNTQIDRLVIVRSLGLSELGSYNLAAALAQVPIVLTTALAVTAFPVFVRVFRNRGVDALGAIMDRIHRPTTWLVALLASHLGVFAPALLSAWVDDPQLGSELRWVALGLVMGSAMLAIQQLTYETLMAQAVTRVNIIMSLLMLPYSLIVTPIAVSRFGLLGGSLAWGCGMTVSTVGYLGYVHWKYFHVGLARSLLTGLLLPFGAAFLWAALAGWAAGAAGLSPRSESGVGALSGLVAAALCLARFWRSDPAWSRSV